VSLSTHQVRAIGHRGRMDRPVVVPVQNESDSVPSLQLWAAPRIIVVTQFLAGAVFLVMALVNLLGDEPSGGERFIGVLAAVVSGMAFGVAGSLQVQGRMVRRHLERCGVSRPAA
jgi:hypothetical protein